MYFYINKQHKSYRILPVIMEETSNENNAKYISDSRANIDNYIRNHKFKKAFGLLILFLERLNDKEKTDVIDYYCKKLPKFVF
jgi:hypothetical protein